MGISRRDAMKLAGAGMALTATAPTLSLGAAADRTLYPAGGLLSWPILQGPTDDRSASFVILFPDDYAFDIRISDDMDRVLPWRIADRYVMADVALAATEIVAGGLAPGREYMLELLDTEGNAFDRRRFGALDLANSRSRFAVASCMFDAYARHSVTMWEALAREQCDFVVLLGDTCYADKGNPNHEETGYHRRYSEIRLTLSWFRMERLVPTFLCGLGRS